MASIGDVAKRAGVSLGTASRAINGNPAVSPQLRERVLAAAAELDYRPNALARALRSSRTHSLGLIVPDVTNPFFGELAKQIEQVAAGMGHTVMLANSNDDPKAEAEYIKVLVGRQVDGLLIVPSEETRPTAAARPRCRSWWSIARCAAIRWWRAIIAAAPSPPCSIWCRWAIAGSAASPGPTAPERGARALRRLSLGGGADLSRDTDSISPATPSSRGSTTIAATRRR